jgi:hypothetical protein
MTRAYLGLRGMVSLVSVLILLSAGVCLAQIPANGVLEESYIPDQNIRLLLDTRSVASQDAVAPRTLGWKRLSGGSVDQPTGILLWQWLGIDDTECVSSISDVNDDGYPDVLAENYDAGASGNNFTCLSGHTEGGASVIWSVYPMGSVSNSGGYGDQCVNSISDINGDGYQDALLGTAWGNCTVFAINGRSGAILWYYDTHNDPHGSGWIYSVAPIEDVDGDSVADVLAGSGTSTWSAFCFSGATGNMLWSLHANDAIGTVHQITDVNGDGVPDALAGAWGNGADRRIYCVSGASVGNASIIWQYQTGGDVQSVTSIPDVNDNGVDDVVAASWDDNVYCREGSNGSQIWTYPFGSIVSRAEVVPDVNGDGIWDVIAGGWSNTVHMINGAAGTAIWTRALNGGNTWTVYPLGDVDNDGIGDVVAGNSISGGTGGMVYVLSGVDGSIIWDYQTNGWVNTVRGISDVNGDELDDVIAGNQSGPGPYVWCFEGDTLAGGMPPVPELLVSEFTTISIYDAQVEIYNLATDDVDLSGLMILQYSPEAVDTAIVNDGVTISGEGYQVINLANSVGLEPAFESGILVLALPNGTTIDSVGYGGMGGAPAPPLEWSTALDLTSSGEWAQRYTLDPTPTFGEPNDAPTAQLGVTAIVINEVYPLGGEGNAFVELYNTSSNEVDLGGWMIVGGTPYEVPSGTMINPHDYFLLWESDFPPFFGCEPEGDNLYLMDSDGVRVDQMGWWFSSASDSSWSAVPDGNRTVFDGFDLATSTDFQRTIPSPGGSGVPDHNGNNITVYSFDLGPVYPNPFNPSARIFYSLNRGSTVRLIIDDILGRHVATLVDGEQEIGSHSVIWDASNVASGTYFAVLEAGKDVRTVKMTLLK